MNTPRIFVGTLCCGEGDYDDCVNSVLRQSNVIVEHVIIRDLPEQEAHNELYVLWTLIKQSFDAFVKVDADTVLAHDNVLASYANMLSDNSRVTGIQAPLHDYFTDDMINGLNCYTPSVVFSSSPVLYCDRTDTNHDIVLKAKDVVSELKPAGYHCHKASDVQAFHFGYHRGLKNQHDVMNRVILAWQKHKDHKRALAIAGFNAAKTCTHNADYSSVEFKEMFDIAVCNTKSALKI